MRSRACGLSRKFVSATVVVLVAAWVGPSFAQERMARVYGVIRDNTGGVIPGATVVLVQTQTGLKTELITNEAGVYNAPKLVTGPYTLEVEQAGFKKYVRTGMVLVPGDVVEAGISLEVGARSDVVTVTEQAPLVNLTTGTSRTTFETELVDKLPLNARDARELVKLTPGSVVDYTNTVHVNGIDTYQNNFSLDGTTNRDPYGHTQVQAPTPDALKEFSVETNYSAEYGNGAGAAVLMTTKSGTNQLHGSVYDYFRAENLNANSFQRNYVGLGKGDFKRHQVGFTVGGPVYLPKLYNGKDKTFFFFSPVKAGRPDGGRAGRRLLTVGSHSDGQQVVGGRPELPVRGDGRATGHQPRALPEPEICSAVQGPEVSAGPEERGLHNQQLHQYDSHSRVRRARGSVAHQG